MKKIQICNLCMSGKKYKRTINQIADGVTLDEAKKLQGCKCRYLKEDEDLKTHNIVL